MKKVCGILVAACLFFPLTTSATITDYSGDESGFNAAISGLGNTLIDFEDLTVDDIISNQYEPPVQFLTNSGYDITAQPDAWGTAARSGLCAKLPSDPPGGTFGEFRFSQPVRGVSLWILDVHQGVSGGLDVTVFNNTGMEIASYWVESDSPYTHVAVLSDMQGIARVRVDTIYTDDGIGFDDVTIAYEPITVLAPNGGEELISGQTETIRWEKGTTVYSNDFEGSIGPEWSNDTNDTTPGTPEHAADRFLGQFYADDGVVLTLNNLPSHTELTLSFDLYIIKTWDGISSGYVQPDIWDLSVSGGSTLLHTTFGNYVGIRRQSYPGTYPGGDYESRTGAAENNTLGFTFEDSGIKDSVYSFDGAESFTFFHSDDSISLVFSGDIGDINPNEESWGIDNIEVSIIDINEVKLEYSANDGNSWNVIDSNTINDGTYEWLVPEVTSNQCLVRMSDVNDANIYDTSDDVFTIFVCQLLSRADLNDDCKVDFSDFSLFALDWLRTGNPFDVYDLYEYNGHHYALTLTYETWQEAEDEAVSFGGHLVTINDVAEDMWLYGTFHSSSESVWIGFYQLPGSPEPADGWVWISGEPVTYTGWGGDEPNNGYGSGEDYGAFHTAGWYWNDYPAVRGIIEFPW